MGLSVVIGSVSTQGFQCSQFRVALVSCLFVFLNCSSESFGWFSRSIRFGDVCFHFLLLEVCVDRSCACKFCADAISRENFSEFCHPSCMRRRLRPLGRFLQKMLCASMIRVCSGNRSIPKHVCGLDRFNPLGRKCDFPGWLFRLNSGVQQDEGVLFLGHCVLFSVLFV